MLILSCVVLYMESLYRMILIVILFGSFFVFDSFIARKMFENIFLLRCVVIVYCLFNILLMCV